MNAALNKAQIEITYGEIDLAYHSEIEVFMGAFTDVQYCALTVVVFVQMASSAV